jgi:hypothetical protein
MFRSASGSIRSSKNSLALFAMAGVMRMKSLSCRTSSGTRNPSARATTPIRTIKVTSIATPRGISRESARTGNDNTMASAVPPSATMRMLGAA